MDEELRSLMVHGAIEVAKETAAALWHAVNSFRPNARMEAAIEDLNKELQVQRIAAGTVRKALARDQFQPLFTRLLIDVVHSANDDRRRVLRAAMLGLIKFDDAAELQSRIVRVVLAIEPSDIVVLKEWADHPSPRPSKDAQVSDWAATNKFGEEFSVAALEAANCITHGMDGRTVNALGRAVLRYVISG